MGKADLLEEWSFVWDRGLQRAHPGHPVQGGSLGADPGPPRTVGSGSAASHEPSWASPSLLLEQSSSFGGGQAGCSVPVLLRSHALSSQAHASGWGLESIWCWLGLLPSTSDPSEGPCFLQTGRRRQDSADSSRPGALRTRATFRVGILPPTDSIMLLPWTPWAFLGNALPACVPWVRAEVLLLSFSGREEDSPRQGWGWGGCESWDQEGSCSSREPGDKLRQETRCWAGKGALPSGEDEGSGPAGGAGLRALLARGRCCGSQGQPPAGQC